MFYAFLSTSLQVQATECEQVNFNEVDVQFIRQVSKLSTVITITIGNQELGTDQVVCQVLIVGEECQGKLLGYSSSFHPGESVIWDKQKNKCFQF
jgi:hypothetical protein